MLSSDAQGAFCFVLSQRLRNGCGEVERGWFGLWAQKELLEIVTQHARLLGLATKEFRTFSLMQPTMH